MKKDKRITFRLNKDKDNQLILELEKYENLSQLIREVLKNNLIPKKNEVIEDAFIINDKNKDKENQQVIVKTINKKANISKNTIKWDNPKLK